MWLHHAFLCIFSLTVTAVSLYQGELSLRYELSGGFIKNAVLSALSIAISRDRENPVICHKDLQQGANLQLRGALRMKVHVYK